MKLLALLLATAPFESARMADGREWTTRNLNVNIAPSYCYAGLEENCRQYGRLYTWESAQKACQSLGNGWRLPTDEEWRKLAVPFGGIRDESGAGGKTAFQELLTGGKSGFNAVLGGGRTPTGEYTRAAAHGFYWTATETTPDQAWFYNFGRGAQALGHHADGEKVRALSVRCIREEHRIMAHFTTFSVMSLLLPLVAVGVSIWEERKSTQRGFRKLGVYQWLALILGVIGTGLSFHEHYKTQVDAKEQEDRAKLTLAEAATVRQQTSEMLKQMETMERTMGTTLRTAQGLDTSLRATAGGLATAIRNSGAKLAKAVSSSTETTANALKDAHDGIVGDLGRVQSAVGTSTDKLQKRLGEIDGQISQSAGQLASTIQSSANASAGIINERINERTRHSIDQITSSMNLNLARFPLVVWQGDSTALVGELAGLELKVGEIHGRSKDKLTEVRLIETATGSQVQCAAFNFKKLGQGAAGVMRFERSGKGYLIEMRPRTPTNLFGHSDDFLNGQVVPEDAVSRVRVNSLPCLDTAHQSASGPSTSTARQVPGTSESRSR